MTSSSDSDGNDDGMAHGRYSEDEEEPFSDHRAANSDDDYCDDEDHLSECHESDSDYEKKPAAKKSNKSKTGRAASKSSHYDSPDERDLDKKPAAKKKKKLVSKKQIKRKTKRVAIDSEHYPIPPDERKAPPCDPTATSKKKNSMKIPPPHPTYEEGVQQSLDGLQLKYFLDGIPHYSSADPVAPTVAHDSPPTCNNPGSPSKTHPARKKRKKQVSSSAAVAKKPKTQPPKKKKTKVEPKVPHRRLKTSFAKTESRQNEIANNQGRMNMTKMGLVNLGMTTRIASSTGKTWQLIFTIAITAKVKACLNKLVKMPTVDAVGDTVLMNKFPLNPADITLFMRIDLNHNSRFDTNRGFPTQAIVTNISSNARLQRCQTHETCGRSLDVGSMVIVNGTDIRYMGCGTYFLGVYKLRNGKLITCKIGYVRVAWDEVKFVCNRIGCVEKIVHQAKINKKDKMSRPQSESLQMKCKGYLVINFVDRCGPLFVGKNVEHAGTEWNDEERNSQGGKEKDDRKE